jgi:uncharacterized protein YkwD
MRRTTRVPPWARCILVAGTIATAALAGPWGGAAAQGTCANADSGPEAGTAALADAVTCLLAEERAAAGLSPLVVHGSLMRSAQGHAADMVARGYLAANSPDGTTPATRAVQANYPSGAVSFTVGEAFTFGEGANATPRAAVAAWRADPDFRSVVLDPDADDLGVGVLVGAPFAVDSPAATYVADVGTRLRPELARTVVVGPSGGVVLVKVPGSRRFVRLTKRRALRVGSIVDTRRGKVRLTSARDGAGHTQTAEFFDGTFKVIQKRGTGGVTEVRLTGSLDCPGAGTATASAKKKPKPRVWGNGRGKFRTRGKYGTATVVGTRWLTEDTCAGTRIYVQRGVVVVRDARTGRTHRVTAGHSLLLRARG